MRHRLVCSLTGKEHRADIRQNLSEAGRPLLAKYDLTPDYVNIKDQPNLWRYADALPDCEPLTLGEGWTPLIDTAPLGINGWIKDESLNPGASFKARGMSVAVAMARHFGITRLAVPSAGNAGGALAAYAAAANIEVTVVMPADTPRACVIEARSHGAEVILLDALIHECGAWIAERKDERGWFDMSTLKEPYRLEGKKTMGYELFEQLGKLPDAIIYPTGGGTGLIGMWKAFDEMQRLGWIGDERPRMFVVQAAGCQPIVRAFHKGARFAETYENASTAASGLRVPKAVGDFLILDAVRESTGSAIAVTDQQMISAATEIAAKTGVFACPEGGATLAAARALINAGIISETELTVLFNTGSGLKYLEALG